MNVSLIAAIGLNREIGYQNRLLWHIPADLKRFKNITTGHTVIMGRKTFESIGEKPLPKRKNIIITSRKDYNGSGIEIAHSIEQAVELARNDGEVFILGGAAVYKQFMPCADSMYLTIVKKNYIADAYFPEFEWNLWRIVEQIDIKNDTQAGVEYSFVTLSRIR